ncbi:MAG: hypothetical protein EBT50_08720 [Verrucomicrobia bacterium]|nr:hypothetical protein [Verrucomicrobiota bacterium]
MELIGLGEDQLFFQVLVMMLFGMDIIGLVLVQEQIQLHIVQMEQRGQDLQVRYLHHQGLELNGMVLILSQVVQERIR